MEDLNSQPIRVRIAPSPTGFMHIGTLRTALTNFLFAQKNKGTFIIRLEDTDQKRFVEGSTEDLIQSLAWLGLSWDEGVKLNGNGDVIEEGEYGPYVQSQRLRIYQKYIKELIDKGDAYYCFCPPERLEKMRQEQQKQKKAPCYDKKCLKLPQSEIEERIRKGEKYVIRLKVPPEGVTEFNDLIRGKISIENKLIDDQVLIKSDGFPTYHFAVVIDDHLMKISHVLRAEEWLPSTPKHILIYQALGWKIPQFGHLPQLLNINGKKLSKRDGDVSVRDFIKKGYQPEALLNFIALLGWNPKTTQEFFSMTELVDQFDLGKINKAGAKFDYSRLDWFGNQYFKKLSAEELVVRAMPYLKEKNIPEEKAERIIAIKRERISKLSDITEDIDYLIKPTISYDKKLLRWKEMSNPEIIESLKKSQIAIERIDNKEYSLENIEQVLLNEAGEKRGELLWPLRVALTGQEKSPSPFECAWVLGKEETLKRINQAIANVS